MGRHVTVEVAQGRLEGFEHKGLRIFRGIPYARPPVGPLRFRRPQPPQPWPGVRRAVDFGPSAPQVAMRLGEVMPGFDVGPQSEDCLYLNVFAPATEGARRPVMVWIHGGAFTLGSASQKMYDVRRMAREGDVVIVTINYRLGALAFLHLAGLDPRLETTANAGILDQAQALRWVRENVAAFGGDPGRVTIFGESAGGFSVGGLLGLPGARGLFHRAIPMSGAAHHVNEPDVASEVAHVFLEKAGLSTQRLEGLWDLPPDAVLKLQADVEAHFLEGTHSRPFRPVLDGEDFADRPIDAIRGGLSSDVPVMVGACRDEEKLFTLWDPAARELDEAGLRLRVDRAVPGRGEHLVQAYRAARAERGEDTSPYELYAAIETDRIFRVPAVRLAEAQSRHQDATWSYLVTWQSPALEGRLGACHGIDLPFVFGKIGSAAGALLAGDGPEAERLSGQMMGAWLAFAHGGDPRHELLREWAPHDEERRATMLFGRETALVDGPLEGERRAWDGIL